MPKLESTFAIDTLLDLRKRAGYSSYDAFAKAAGYKGASSIQRYFTVDGLDEGYLPLKFVKKIEKALMGKGDPPIQKHEIYSMAGIELDESGGFETADMGVIAQSGIQHLIDAFEADQVPELTSYSLNNNRIAKAVPASKWSGDDPTEVRPVRSGLVVICEFNSDPDTRETFTLGEIGDQKILIPTAPLHHSGPIHYLPGNDWHDGEANIGDKTSKCRILAVPLTITETCNAEFLD